MDVDSLLRMPDQPSERESAWKRLTTGNVLVMAMRGELKAGLGESTCDGWFRHLDRWMTNHIAFVDSGDVERMLPQWRMANRVVCCAVRALEGVPDRRLFSLADAHHRGCLAHLVPWAVLDRFAAEGIRDDETRAIMDCLIKDSTPLPDAVTRYDGWTWHCIAWLLSVESRAAEVPVAVYLGEGKASLATLLVEVVEDGAGHVVPHPEDTFAPWPFEHFHKSLSDAFSGAVSLFNKKNETSNGGNERPLCDGRFRLRWRSATDGDAMSPAPNGRSASAAAALAFYHALHTPATYPDPCLIVMAQVSEEDVSRLAGVNNIKEKTQAVVEAFKAARSPLEQIDTIAVASATNKQEAEVALAATPTADGMSVHGWPIRVVIPGGDSQAM